MKLNFYLEIAALCIGIILWIETSGRYAVRNLKDQVFIYMIRSVTVINALNMVGCVIVRRNVFVLMWLAELIICLSFLLMVWIWVYYNVYCIEIIRTRNVLPIRTQLLLVAPSFCNILMIIANWGFHELFDMSKVDGNIHIVFNPWYKIPYILVLLSALVCIVRMIQYRDRIIEEKQQIVFVIPVIMLVAYLLQYRLKSTMILGFAYAFSALLLYLYSYRGQLWTDAATQLPDGAVLQDVLSYALVQNKVVFVEKITLPMDSECGFRSREEQMQCLALQLSKVMPNAYIVRYGAFELVAVSAGQMEDNRKAILVQKCEKQRNPKHMRQLPDIQELKIEVENTEKTVDEILDWIEIGV